MDTELLKTFLEVNKTRHFRRAAENLYITQAAVSARIKQLEEIFGAPLFIRKRNNIQLSSEGERLIPHAEIMLIALSRARQEVAAPHAVSRRVQVGVRTGIWGDALQNKLHKLQRDLPDLAIQIESLEPDSLTKRLLDRTLDIAIVYELPSILECSSVPIGEFTLKLYSSVRGESLKSALAGNYIYLDWGGGFARFHERRFGDLPPPALSTNINSLARDYLLANGGACFLPESLQQCLASDGLTLVNDAPDFVRQLNIAFHSGSAHRSLIEQVINTFVDVKV